MVMRYWIRQIWLINLFWIPALLLLPSITMAEWPNQPNVNLPIDTSTGDQINPQIISDDSGGSIIAWENQNGVLYAQRINGDGEHQWSEGTRVCNDQTIQSKPQLVSDGTGGAIVSWIDARGAGGGDPESIYAQRIDKNGAEKWANCVKICDAPGRQYDHRMVRDNASGAVITWTDERYGTTDTDIYAQRISTLGLVQWTTGNDGTSFPNGFPVGGSGGNQTKPQIINDGTSATFITWEDERPTNGGIFAQYLNPSGTPQWTPNGLKIYGDDTLIAYRSPKITRDGTDGAIIVWEDGRDGDLSLYAHRVNSNGVLQWQNSMPVVNIGGALDWKAQMISDNAGGAIVVWEEKSNQTNDTAIFTQRINANGKPQWKVNGIHISGNSGGENTGFPQLVPDGNGGAVITWHGHGIHNELDIFAQRISSSGIKQWANNGVAVSSAFNFQYAPQLISDGSGGAIVTWADARNVNSDIYAQRVFSGGKLQPSSPIIFPVRTNSGKTAIIFLE